MILHSFYLFVVLRILMVIQARITLTSHDAKPHTNLKINFFSPRIRHRQNNERIKLKQEEKAKHNRGNRRNNALKISGKRESHVNILESIDRASENSIKQSKNVIPRACTKPKTKQNENFIKSLIWGTVRPDEHANTREYK